VLYGKIANRLPQQLLIGLGATLTACTGFLLMGINTGTGTPQLFWPLVVRGLGSVMMFMPLSIATLGPLPKKDIPAGAGFYSLTRQLGSSIGIALITTMLARRINVHRAILVSRVTDFSQPAIERLGMLGGSLGAHGAHSAAGRQGALAVIDRIINGQAALLAYSDIFFYVAILFLASLPLILLLGDKHKKPDPAPVTPAEEEAVEEAEAEAAVH
jgi:DHA2 family multidrug resistance protein